MRHNGSIHASFGLGDNYSTQKMNASVLNDGDTKLHHNDTHGDNSDTSEKSSTDNEVPKSKEMLPPLPLPGVRASWNSTSEEDSKKHPLPPPLSFDPWSKKYSIIVCTLGLLFFDLVLPCIIYYNLQAYTDLSIEINLGISCASLGLGEMMELPLRGYRLVKYRSSYAPLGQEAKWGFDFLFWWYLVATVIGIVPYVMSTSLDEPILWLFLFTPGFLTILVVITGAVSAVPFILPFRVSSDEKGTRCKPFAYYVIEDFIAVDAGQMRGYREQLRERWIASPGFRRLIWDVNMWWTIGGVVFTGVLAGITWGTDFDVAYGLSFGMLFLWIGVWAGLNWLWVRRELRREREWFARTGAGIEGGVMETEKEKEKELDLV